MLTLENLTAYAGFSLGDKVSVKATDKAYDTGSPITPDMIGTIKAFPAKVQKVKGPLYDRRDHFAYIQYENARAGIDICNLIKVK